MSNRFQGSCALVAFRHFAATTLMFSFLTIIPSVSNAQMGPPAGGTVSGEIQWVKGFVNASGDLGEKWWLAEDEVDMAAKARFLVVNTTAAIVHFDMQIQIWDGGTKVEKLVSIDIPFTGEEGINVEFYKIYTRDLDPPIHDHPVKVFISATGHGVLDSVIDKVFINGEPE